MPMQPRPTEETRKPHNPNVLYFILLIYLVFVVDAAKLEGSVQVSLTRISVESGLISVFASQ